MDLTVKCSGIACCERVFEYAMPVEDASETVVPDTMPDVERILCAEGMVMIRSKEVTNERVTCRPWSEPQCCMLRRAEKACVLWARRYR